MHNHIYALGYLHGTLDTLNETQATIDSARKVHYDDMQAQLELDRLQSECDALRKETMLQMIFIPLSN